MLKTQSNTTATFGSLDGEDSPSGYTQCVAAGRGIEEPALSVRIARALRKKHIASLGVLRKKTLSEVQSIPNLGRKSFGEVVSWVVWTNRNGVLDERPIMATGHV